MLSPYSKRSLTIERLRELVRARGEIPRSKSTDELIRVLHDLDIKEPQKYFSVPKWEQLRRAVTLEALGRLDVLSDDALYRTCCQCLLLWVHDDAEAVQQDEVKLLEARKDWLKGDVGDALKSAAAQRYPDTAWSKSPLATALYDVSGRLEVTRRIKEEADAEDPDYCLTRFANADNILIQSAAELLKEKEKQKQKQAGPPKPSGTPAAAAAWPSLTGQQFFLKRMSGPGLRPPQREALQAVKLHFERSDEEAKRRGLDAAHCDGAQAAEREKEAGIAFLSAALTFMRRSYVTESKEKMDELAVSRDVAAPADASAS
jgi:hypothetical protein